MRRLIAPFRYYGGKGNMLAKLMRLVPAGGQPYCEPFCGAASLFFARSPAPVEVLNDINGDIVNVFRCLQDKALFEELSHRLKYTPYARSEYIRALKLFQSRDGSELDRAWATIVAFNFSVSASPQSEGNWSRVFTYRRGMAQTTAKWLARLSFIEQWHERLMRVQIDCRDAIEVIRYWDNTEAVFYVDPPYPLATRNGRKAYQCEMTDDQHEQLVECLLGCKGAVILSCYHHPIYEPLAKSGWTKHEFQTACHAAGRVRNNGILGKGSALLKVPRVEVVWQNPKAQEATSSRNGVKLFA